MLTLQLAPEAVIKSGCKAGFEVGIKLCSSILTFTKLYGSILASILGPPSFDIYDLMQKRINVDFSISGR